MGFVKKVIARTSKGFYENSGASSEQNKDNTRQLVIQKGLNLSNEDNPRIDLRHAKNLGLYNQDMVAKISQATICKWDSKNTKNG